MTDPIIRPLGSTGDLVVLPDGRIAHVYVAGTTIVCEVDGAQQWVVDMGRPMAFLRAAVDVTGQIMAIVHSGFNAWLMRRTGPDTWTARAIGSVFGNCSVALDSWHAYLVIAADVVRRIPLDGLPFTDIPKSWGGQGIRDVVNGAIVSGDLTLSGTIDGHNFGEFQRRDGWVVGQSGWGIGALVDGAFFYARTPVVNVQNQREVHAVRVGARFAVCAWIESGAFYREFTLPHEEVDLTPPVINSAAVEPWRVTFLTPTWAAGEVVRFARANPFVTRIALGNGVEVEFQKDAQDALHVAVFKDGVEQDRSGRARLLDVRG